MRIDTPEFSDLNSGRHRAPVFVIELSFDDANTDLHYLTSAPVSGLTGNVINDTLRIVSSTSQKITPEKARSTTGSIKFECLDEGLTTLQRDKLDNDKGLNGKRVRLHKGFDGALWEDFSLIETQRIDGAIDYENGVYKFQCADISRAMRTEIFDPKETTLRGSITATQTTLPVYNTSGFEVVYQVPSAEGKTMLRALQAQSEVSGAIDEVGFLKIEGENEDFEIAMWWGKTADEFTNVYRGVFGTKPIAVDVSTDANADNAPKVSEYIYLEMPAIKAAYAIATGSLWGHAGKFLPDHWHLGISGDYINSSSFVNIGADLWDTSDDDKGYAAVIRGPKKTDGKKYIEEKLLYMVGCYHTIQQTGELRLKRVQDVGASGSYVIELNEDNLSRYGALRHSLKDIVNRFAIKWNYNDRKEENTRLSGFIDQESIDRHGASKLKTLELPALHGSRHSYQVIRYHFESIATRTVGPPLLITVEGLPELNNIEVGDIVRLNLPKVKDFTNGTQTSLNRNFEVQSVSINWLTGEPRFQLFGSSEKVSNLVPDQTEAVGLNIADFGTIISNGTEINATNFPGAVTSNAGVTTITADINLTGHSALANSNAVYYCAEDLVIDAAATVTVNDNTIIFALGYLTENGIIDGKGRGHAGGAVGGGFYNTGNGHLYADAANLGAAGIGNTSPQGGFVFTRSAASIFLRPKGVTGLNTLDVATDRRVTGLFDQTPRPLLTYDADGINGFPSTLMGSSGSSGAGVADYTGGGSSYEANGGAGGAGGAGLMIISAGMSFGAGGRIDLSGDDGLVGESHRPSTQSQGLGQVTLYAGAGGGGHSGGLIYVNLDSAQNTPTFDATNTILENGLCPKAADYRDDSRTVENGYSHRSYSSGKERGKFPVRQNTVEDNAQIVFLDPERTANEDLPEYVQTAPTFTLTEQVNTPHTPQGNRSTIEVSVTPPPGDDNYSYSNVYFRVQGSDAWTQAMPASNEALIVVPSDGETYEVQIRPVAKSSGKETPSGEIKTITVTDINGRTDAQLAAIYPLVSISGLQLKDVAGTVFTGLGPEWVWNNDNNELVYFQYYGVSVYDGSGNLLRTEKSVSPFYEYTYEKNREDYTRIEGQKGVYNDIEIRVNAVSKVKNNLNQYYGNAPAVMAVSSSNTFDRENLRFKIAHDQQVLDDLAAAGGGGTLTTYYTPTEPASPTTGDIWFDTTAGENHIYRYNGTTWDSAQDSGIAAAVNAAQTAQTTADGKALVFYQESAPVIGTNPGEASEGDLWYQASTKTIKRLNGSNTWDLVGTAGATWNGDIAGQPSDDQIDNNNATPYTLVATSNIQVTGSRVEKLSGNAWDESARSVESFTDGAFISFRVPQTDKRIMFGLNTDPETDNTYTGIDYLFYIRSDGTFQVRVNGSSVSGNIAYSADDAFSITYDGKRVEYRHNGTLVHSLNDEAADKTLYIDSSFLDAGGVIESLNFGPYTKTQSSEVDALETQNGPAEAGADVTGNNTSNDTNNVNGVPSSTITSDLTQALQDAANAQSTADGKIVTFFQGTTPSGADVGDLWFDSSSDNLLRRFNGSSWVETDDLRIANAVTAANNAQTTADGKALVYSQEATPSGTAGDLWFTPSTGVVRRHNGSSWVIMTLEADYVKAGVSMTSPTITGGLVRTASSGDRLELDGSDNSFKSYLDDGHASGRRVLVDIGLTTGEGNLNHLAVLGDDNCQYPGLNGRSKTAHGLAGSSVDNYGVIGRSVNGEGMLAQSDNSFGVVAESDGNYAAYLAKAGNGPCFQVSGQLGLANGGILWPCIVANTEGLTAYRPVKIKTIIHNPQTELALDNEKWLFEIEEILQSGGDAEILGIASPMSRTFNSDDYLHFGWPSGDLNSRSSTHKLWWVFVPGAIIPAMLNTANGNILAGNSLTTTNNANGGLVRSDDGAGRKIIGKALDGLTGASGTTGLRPIMLRGS